MKMTTLLVSCLTMIPASKVVDADLRFDGKQGQVRIPDLRCRGENPLTIECIVTPQMPTDKYGRIVSNIAYSKGRRGGLAIGISKGYWQICIETQRGLRRLQSDHPAVNGARTHFAAMFDQDRVTMFINGEKNETSLKLTHTMEVSDQDFLLGCERLKGGGQSVRFQGDLEAIRFSSVGRYKRDFKPDQKLEADGKTLLLYHFDRDPGGTCRDLSGFQLDGAVSDLAWVMPDARREYADIEELQKSIGLYEVKRKIKGGVALKTAFYELTEGHDIQEKGRKVGSWKTSGRNEVELVIEDDPLGPVALSLEGTGQFSGSQEQSSREVEWNLQRIRIAMLWLNKRYRGETLRTQAEMELYSNGKINRFDSDDTWEIRGDTLRYLWNGKYESEFKLSRDQQTYLGTNVQKETVRGIRLQ